MKLDKQEYETIRNEIQKVGEPIGLEFHPFLVGWYNQRVANKFFLPYTDAALAFCVISTSKYFENCFLPYVKELKCNFQTTSDPFDQSFVKLFREIRENFVTSYSYNIDIIHDFELDSRRRPKLLVQTAGHVSGAAYYYQRVDVLDDPWGDKKIFGASCHPEVGGWFGFRGGLIFEGIEHPALEKRELIDFLTREQKVQFLESFNFNWQTSGYRDVYNVSGRKYSELQMSYFRAKPKERFEFLKSNLNELDLCESVNR